MINTMEREYKKRDEKGRFKPGYFANKSLCKVEDMMRCIEVKTTVSRNRVRTNSFHMSTNEWIAAKTYKDVYFVYRLLISGDSVTLFIIQDIAGKEKQSLVDMVPRNGAEIKYTAESGWIEELLA